LTRFSEGKVDRYNLEDIIRTTYKSLSSQLHTSIPGVITKWKAQTQTVDVQVTVDTPTYLEENIPAPIIEDVPLVFPSGKGWFVAGKPVAGDAVLLHICHYPVRDWLRLEKNTKVASPSTYRTHNLTDCFATPGVSNREGTLARGKSSGTTDLEVGNKQGSAHFRPTEIFLQHDEQLHVYLDNNNYIKINQSELTINSNSTVNVNAPTVEVDASSEINLTAPNVNVTGILNVTGVSNLSGGYTFGTAGASGSVSGVLSLPSSGDVLVGSISSKNHTHTEQGDGNEVSSPN